jgi:hypothetical protein
VQEALTNVSRHAGRARTAVHLHYAQDALAAQANDDGKGVGATSAGPGLGLIGMRERVSALGGGLGSANTGLVAQWNGSAWNRLTVPLPSNAGPTSTLNAISANGPDDVWIVGTYELSPTDLQNETYSLHWNGSTWSVVPMPLNPSSNVNAFFHFNSIQANSPTDVWAVGDQGVAGTPNTSTLIEHWNGTAWSVVPSPSPGLDGSLAGVTASNANDVWAVGSSGVCCTENPLVLQNG